MFKTTQRRSIPYLLRLRRQLGNIQAPFQEDLTSVSYDDFNLSDFQHYKESPDVIAKKLELLNTPIKKSIPNEEIIDKQTEVITQLSQYTSLKEPLVFVSELTNPYLNLAIEDYIYNEMPIPQDTEKNYNRLMFYKNSPCVVIGKNQNPWNEVNIPLLNSLNIPLIRRRSGGGTVVHDLGNVNYSFMTTKSKFDRHTFAELVKNAVNRYSKSKYKLVVNERGDITTEEQPNGISYKISGSAYKLSKGRSYHHGTMLLNSRLDILGKLLSRDESKLGIIDSMSSIDSVKSNVINLELESDKFIELVTKEFSETFCEEKQFIENQQSQEENESEEFDQNELFGLSDFVEANSLPKTCKVIKVNEMTELPQSVMDVSNELRQWDWRFGATPKFTHVLYNEKFGFTIKFFIKKNAIIDKFELTFDNIPNRLISIDKIEESFEFLDLFIKKNELKYAGSNIAGFITNDIISSWVGQPIDGTI